MVKKRIIYAITNATIFTTILILVDLTFERESFAKDNYWKKQLFFGIFLFGFYLIIYQFKDLKWKDIFSKKKKTYFNKS